MIEKVKKFDYTPEQREQAKRDLAEMIEDMVCAYGGFAELPKNPVVIGESPFDLHVTVPVDSYAKVGLICGPGLCNIAALLQFVRLQQIMRHNKKIHLSLSYMAPDGLMQQLCWSCQWIFTKTGADITEGFDFFATRGEYPPHIKRCNRHLYRIFTRTGEPTKLGLSNQQKQSLDPDWMQKLNLDLDSETVDKLDVDDYAEMAGQTAIYPHRGDNLPYAILGLTSEAGELAGVYKKVIRDNGGCMDAESTAKAVKELGDVAWYLAATAHELGIPLSTVLRQNIAKLKDRQARGTLQGSGDNR